MIKKNNIPLIFLFFLTCGISFSDDVIYNSQKIAGTEKSLISAKIKSSSSDELFLISLNYKYGWASRQALTKSGFEILEYISPGAFLVKQKQETSASEFFQKNSGRIKFFSYLTPENKIAPELGKILNSKNDTIISMLVYVSEYNPECFQEIENSGGTVTDYSKTPNKKRLGVKISASELSAFLQKISLRKEIYLIKPASGFKLMNDNASLICQSGYPSSGRPIWDKGIRGEGQIIAVLDTGLDYDSCFFAEPDKSAPPIVKGTGAGVPDLSRRKVLIYNMLYSEDYDLAYNHFDSQGHGTAVAGNALGSKIDDPTGDAVQNGMAPLAKLIVQDAGYYTNHCADLPALGCPVIDLTPFLDQAISQGANIHNNSYGDREDDYPGNSYTGPTADMDDAMWRHKDFLIVCAAGNSGGTHGDNSVYSPSVSKNVISVAAAQSTTYLGNPNITTGFSSRGYASDGRLKPDIAAPGQTRSAQSDGSILTDNCGTAQIQGTSMASPITAGCVALIRQYFTEGWYPSGKKNAADSFIPSSALLKSVLFNGAVDMTGVSTAPPNIYEGWGRIHLDSSLYFEGDAKKIIALDKDDYFTTATLSPFTMQFKAGGNAAAGIIKATLVWTDYPGSPAASKALVNDLDMIVRSDSNPAVYYRGNNINNPLNQPGYSRVGGDPDTINNVEMVILPPTESGIFNVEVTASDIVYGPQGFALVISGDVQIYTRPAGNWTLFY